MTKVAASKTKAPAKRASTTTSTKRTASATKKAATTKAKAKTSTRTTKKVAPTAKTTTRRTATKKTTTATAAKTKTPAPKRSPRAAKAATGTAKTPKRRTSRTASKAEAVIENEEQTKVIVSRQRRPKASRNSRRAQNNTGIGLGPKAVAVVRDQPNEAKVDAQYMNKKQLKHFQEILESQLQKLGEGAGDPHGKLISEPKNLPDELDQATEEDNRRTELRIHDRERKLINKIKETLEKIKNKEYGFCRICEYPIGSERLEARPTADLCINCKDLEEREERQFGS